MGQLIVVHNTFHTITNPLAIAVFLGLAVYVVTCNWRRPVSWVFGLLCLTIASMYMSELLLSLTHISFLLYNFLMRWAWVAVVVSSTLYLHLVFFYFPLSWQRYCFRMLPPLYLICLGLALVSLLTDLLVDGHMYHSVPLLIGSKPAWYFFVFHAGFFTLAVVSGSIGLLANFRSTSSPTLRQQILYLLMTTVFGLWGGIIHWVTIFTETTHYTPHFLSDTLFFLAAILYAGTIVSFGSFAGRPLAGRHLLYSIVAAVSGLAALYLTVALDQWLMSQIFLPYYLVTGLFVVIIAAGFPAISGRIKTGVDKWLFPAEYQQKRVVRSLAEALAKAPNLLQLQAELLDTLRNVLDVDSGYIALTNPKFAQDQLVVQLVHGNLPLQPGDPVRRPPIHGQEPQLASALLPQSLTESGWQDIALFCPLNFDRRSSGVLALGEKRDKRPFLVSDLLFCAELVKQLGGIGRLMRLGAQRSHYLTAAQLQQHTLRQLGQEAVLRSSQRLAAREVPPVPFEIRVLGPLQVTRHGQFIPEAAWGSEKAKGLLAYLLWKTPGGASREELCQALWPERSTDETANVFHVTLHRLRRVLQTESGQDLRLNYILHDRSRYRFDTDAPHWSDLDTFQTLITSAELADLQSAIDLYRGSYLEDMAWVLPAEVEAKRRRLEQLYADALRRLASQAGQREALLYLEKLLVIEPADETAQQALILGYMAQGRGDLARRQISRWRQAMFELDLVASPETQAIWQLVELPQSQKSPQN